MDREEPSFPEEMLFNANLQEFANRIGVICGLEAGGKLSQDAAYKRIKELWKQLKSSKKTLRIGDKPEKAGE